MTELFIDGQQVILPQNFSLTVVEENPFFTKNGKYTYDLELSLENPQNAKIYKHYNRVNNIEEIVSNRQAILKADNEIVLNGTEIILEISDKSVVIQLVSGNSELNYLIGGDRKLRDLELGSAGEPGYYGITAFSVKHRYPATHYVCAPLYSRNEERIYCNFTALIDENTNAESLDFLLGPWNPTPWIPQPYICFIIERILFILGYELNKNEVSNTKYKDLYIVHGFITDEYAKMLPDWTVSEFFEEVEKLFDSLILIDEITKKIDIIFASNYYNSPPKCDIEYVFDEHNDKIDNENTLTHNNANVSYVLPNTEYFKFQNIEKEILSFSKREKFESYNKILEHFNKATDKNTLQSTIFHSEQSDTEYIFFEKEDGGYYPKKVNIFQPIINNPQREDIDIEIKITPVEITTVEIPVILWKSLWSSMEIWKGIIQVPIIDTDRYFVTYEEYVQYAQTGAFGDFTGSIQNLITGEESMDKRKNSELQVAFYQGLRKMTPKGEENSTTKTFNYPMPLTDLYAEYSEKEILLAENNATLRLDGNKGIGEFYNKDFVIDTTRERVFSFENKQQLDIRSVFNIKNKEYVSIKFERTITINGISPKIKGYFYPYKKQKS